MSTSNCSITASICTIRLFLCQTFRKTYSSLSREGGEKLYPADTDLPWRTAPRICSCHRCCWSTRNWWIYLPGQWRRTRCQQWRRWMRLHSSPQRWKPEKKQITCSFLMLHTSRYLLFILGRFNSASRLIWKDSTFILRRLSCLFRQVQGWLSVLTYRENTGQAVSKKWCDSSHNQLKWKGEQSVGVKPSVSIVPDKPVVTVITYHATQPVGHFQMSKVTRMKAGSARPESDVEQANQDLHCLKNIRSIWTSLRCIKNQECLFVICAQRPSRESQTICEKLTN